MLADIDVSNIRIETERLVLRPWTEDDLDDLFDYASEDGVGEMAGWPHHTSKGVSRFILNVFIKQKKTFALELKDTKRVIGSLGLDEHNPDEFDEPNLCGREIGYVLSKKYWGQGLMTEAVRAVIEYCFRVLRYDFLVCGHFVRNDRSRRVVEKSGFRFVRDVDYKTQMETVEPTKLYVIYNFNH